MKLKLYFLDELYEERIHQGDKASVIMSICAADRG